MVCWQSIFVAMSVTSTNAEFGMSNVWDVIYMDGLYLSTDHNEAVYLDALTSETGHHSTLQEGICQMSQGSDDGWTYNCPGTARWLLNLCNMVKDADGNWDKVCGSKGLIMKGDERSTHPYLPDCPWVTDPDGRPHQQCPPNWCLAMDYDNSLHLQQCNASSEQQLFTLIDVDPSNLFDGRPKDPYVGPIQSPSGDCLEVVRGNITSGTCSRSKGQIWQQCESRYLTDTYGVHTYSGNCPAPIATGGLAV